MRIALAAGALTALCLAVVANSEWIATSTDPQLALVEFVTAAMK